MGMKESEKKLEIFPPTTSSNKDFVESSTSCGQSKGGQVNLSFGMIFSIILIIFFIAFAFFAIQKFLGLSETISVGKFADDIQSDIDKLWKSSQGSQELEYSLPKEIEQVCFADLLEPEKGFYESEDYYEEFQKYFTEKNLFFYPIGSTELNGIEIEHIGVGDNNPICFNNDGKVKIVIKKDFGEALVSVVIS